jgi:hypothetical protein
MKVEYKGYEIEVTREKCMGGWGMLYYSVFTTDGHECLSNFEDSGETVRDKISELKELVDDEIKSGDPFGLEEETTNNQSAVKGDQERSE